MTGIRGLSADLKTLSGDPNPASTLITKFHDELFLELPSLRRHARALTAPQKIRDDLATSALELVIEETDVGAEKARTPGIALFRAFHRIWAVASAQTDRPATEGEAGVPALMVTGADISRAALLLYTIEGFSLKDVADILGLDPAEARVRCNQAQDAMSLAMKGKVLIIEDEAHISTDLKTIVVNMGYTCTGIARTEREAIKPGSQDRPDVILADMQLADNSSGPDAVQALFTHFQAEIPVVFISGRPEEVLTGRMPEPAFLISKPYSEARSVRRSTRRCSTLPTTAPHSARPFSPVRPSVTAAPQPMGNRA
ncbi:response regulator [Tritonibacter mobilis]|uniref:response regulator n=1 Tax=Tritonibacter mobilis TaxID=379347 RepID=UPI001445F2CC|nr:response regulator [Rhodobacteraceae bacterium R_SAG6]